MQDFVDGSGQDFLGLAQRIEQAGSMIGRSSASGLFTVQHRWACGDGKVLSHSQKFDAHGGLRCWQLGDDPAALLTIVGRTPSLDGGMPARLHREDAVYFLSDGVPRDVLGLPVEAWRYSSFQLPEIECLALLDAGDGPDGLLRRTIAFSQHMLRGGINRAAQVGADAASAARERSRGAFRVNAPYPALLNWLHTEMVLGHLIQDGYDLSGDLWRLSAMDGMLDATRESYGCGPRDLQVLLQYGFARRHKRTAEIIHACLMEESSAAKTDNL